MCNPTHSESGQLCSIDGCESYKLAQAALTAAQLRYGDLELETARIRSDRDRLAGVVVGMEAQNARIILQYDHLDDIFRQRGFDLSQSMALALKLEKENARLRVALKSAELTAATANSCRDDPWEILADIENFIGNALKEVG